MGYLERRVQFLLDRLEEGNIKFLKSFASSDVGEELINDLYKVSQSDEGSVDLSTCSSLVRSVARALYALEHYEGEPEAEIDIPSYEVASEDISKAMREYFSILEEFFLEVTNSSPEDFVFEDYRSKVLTRPQKQAARSKKAYEKYGKRITEFHSSNTRCLYKDSKALGGLKNVLGGSTRFPQAAYDGVRKFALYSDTIFIPDPLLPFLEVERTEERFQIIEFLRNCRQLLLLKPLVDADLSTPAIVVFPSWEKSFELHDPSAKDGISRMLLGLFSLQLDATFEDESELIAYIDGEGSEEFERAVTENGLFWPPDASGPLEFAKAASKYRDWLHQWRSKDWLENMSNLSDHLLILNGIWERITPQYHIRDNAVSLGAQPLFWLSPHFHYFQLTSDISNRSLNQLGILNDSTYSILSSLLNPQTAWLGDIPITDIARLRENDANIEFRARLRSYVNELSESELDDLDSVANSVLMGIESLLREHDRKAKEIIDKYERKFKRTLATSVLTLAASLYPWLEPWIGLTVLGPAAKASYDYLDFLREERALSRSLTGVLSEAKRVSASN